MAKTVALIQDNAAFSSRNYPAFQDAFHTMVPEINITEMNIGGRLIPRSLVSSNSSAASLSSAIKYILDNGGIFAGVSENVGTSPTSPNSVHPYWRESVFLAFFGMYVLPISFMNSSSIPSQFPRSETSGQATFGKFAM